MPRFESVDHLREYRRQLAARLDPKQPQVLVCAGPGCLPMGSDEVAAAFREELQKNGLEGKVALKECGCQGLCARAVKVLLRPQEIAYQHVTPEDVPEIVEATLKNGQVVERLIYEDPETHDRIACKADIPFYQGQQPVVLRKLDVIDPESLDDYLAMGGYRGLRKVLGEMSPDEVIEAVERVRLAGPGRRRLPHRPQVAHLR